MNSQKNIVRVEKNKNYTTINNTSIQDVRLSWKAKAIHVFMLSRPDDWTFYNSEMVKWAKDGSDAFVSGLKELQKHGYVKKEKRRNDDGTFDWVTVVYEVPYMDLPHMDKPSMEKPFMEKPSMENPKLLSTNRLSTNIPNTNRLNTNYQQEVAATTVSGSLIDSKFAEILNLIGNNLRPLSPFQAEQLGYTYDQYGYELTLEATKEMLSAKDVRKPISYLDSILQKWEEQGVSNLQKLKLYRERGKTYETNQSGVTKEYSDGVNF